MYSSGMYSELNPVYNEVCPPTQMDEMFQHHHHQVPPAYPQQYNSPVDPRSQVLQLAPYGVQTPEQRSFSPGMSGSAGDLRGMGISGHVSAEADTHISPSPRDLISVTNRPDMQWMVTTSNIDMRTVSPPNAMVSHPGLQHGSGMQQGLNSSMATITHHSGYPHCGPSASSSVEQKPIARTKSGKPKGTPGRKRKVEDYELAPEEAAKRHLRRERNKLAAAKCRNRRRELTDRLQGETDILEDHQGMLTQEIFSLQQEKDHLEFILASHSPVCKVLQDKPLNVLGNQSTKHMLSQNSADCMGLRDHGASLVPPIEDLASLSSVGGRLGPSDHASTVSVIQAGPSISRTMHENIYPSEVNSVIVGNENVMHGQYSSVQAEDLRTSGQSSERRFPATLSNLDVLDQVVSGEPLNTPVCTLATPSNTSAVFTFPNTPCITSNSLVSGGMNYSDTFTSAAMDYNCASSGCVMSTGQFLHPSHAQYNSNPGVITSRESCSAAHRRSSSSESHHSPDSVQSPKLLSL